MEDIGLLGEEFIVWALTGLGYTDVRRSTYKYDDKKDGTAITPDGKFITWEGKTENFFQTKPGYTFSPTQTQYDKMQNAGMIFIVDTAWHPWDLLNTETTFSSSLTGNHPAKETSGCTIGTTSNDGTSALTILWRYTEQMIRE